MTAAECCQYYAAKFYRINEFSCSKVRLEHLYKKVTKLILTMERDLTGNWTPTSKTTFVLVSIYRYICPDIFQLLCQFIRICFSIQHFPSSFVLFLHIFLFNFIYSTLYSSPIYVHSECKCQPNLIPALYYFKRRFYWYDTTRYYLFSYVKAIDYLPHECHNDK